MKTTELEGALLDYHTARAEGVPAADLERRANGTLCVRNMPVVGMDLPMVMVLDYSTNWALTGPLVEKHMMDLEVLIDPVRWQAMIWSDLQGRDNHYGDGPTAMIAICRAVVRAAFGDEVEDLA